MDGHEPTPMADRINWQNVAMTLLTSAFAAWAYVGASAKEELLERMNDMERNQRRWYEQQAGSIRENHVAIEVLDRRIEQHINEFYKTRGEVIGDIQMLKQQFDFYNGERNRHSRRDAEDK